MRLLAGVLLVVFIALILLMLQVTTAPAARTAQALPITGQQQRLALPPVSQNIYFMEQALEDLPAVSKLSTVPMVVLFYKRGDKKSQLQETILQDACRGWLNHLRFYRVDVSGSGIVDLPLTLFIQPDSNGYPVLLNSSSYMDRKRTFDFLKAAMKLVKSGSFTAQIQHLSEIDPDTISDVVNNNLCPAVVLFTTEDSVLGQLSEQVILPLKDKYNQRAMFFRCDRPAVGGFMPAVWPSTIVFRPNAGAGKVMVEPLYGFQAREALDRFLQKLPPASPNQ